MAAPFYLHKVEASPKGDTTYVYLTGAAIHIDGLDCFVMLGDMMLSEEVS